MPGKDSATAASSRKETAKKREVTTAAAPEKLSLQDRSSRLALQQALADPQKMRPEDVLALQRQYGNQAVTQLLSNRTLQAKRSPGAANYSDEQQVDPAASQGMAALASAPAMQRVEEEEEIQASPLVQRAQEEDELQASPLVQRAQEDEELQAKFVQRKVSPEGGQGSIADQETQMAPQRPNQTGLPDQLKSGIESLSGISLDDVRVHYGSARPDQVDALAYTQGSEIHVGPGQEQHLPHEAWHVVQQAQGRVQPTMQLQGGVQVNDDTGLEHEADVMGKRALQMKRSDQLSTDAVNPMQLVSEVAQLQPKPQFANEKLKNYANALFKARPAQGAVVGDGSALAACSHEVNGGAQVGGADHIKKCEDILNGIENLIDRHENPKSPFALSDDDYRKAMKLESDLQDALDGVYVG